MSDKSVEKLHNEIVEHGFTFWYMLYNVAREINEECYNKNGKNNKDTLTFPQYTVLQLIEYLGEECILKEIANKGCISKAALSIMLSKLDFMGLVEKEESSDKDRRKSNIKLTEKGRKALKDKKEEVFNCVVKMVKGKLNSEEIDYLVNELPKSIKVLEKLEK